MSPPNEPRIRVADFFCGCGGTSSGLRAAGMEIAVGLDFDAEASATYRHNFPEAIFIERDIRAVDPGEVAHALDRTGGTHLLLSACAPCQPFTSFRGSGKGSGRRRSRTLLVALIPFVEALQPDYVLLENVPGLEEASRRRPFARFVSALRRLGYQASWDVVDCQHVGVPQRRRRLVLLASRHGEIELPSPTHGPARQPVSTVDDWIGDLPAIAAGEVHEAVPNHRAGALGELNLKRIRAVDEGGGRLDWPSELVLDCHRHHDGHEDVYGRMRGDAPAPVLTTKCTSLSNGRFGHPTQDRAISVREAASLQTFPRDFIFVGGLRSTSRQVGNAVPVLLARRLGDAVMEHVRSLGPPK